MENMKNPQSGPLPVIDGHLNHDQSGTSLLPERGVYLVVDASTIGYPFGKDNGVKLDQYLIP